MKSFRQIVLFALLSSACVVAVGCKKACHDLEDVCAGCSGDDRSSCDAEHDACDMLKGKLGDDCCEAILDEWQGYC
jgi:hypothetical protein